MKGMGFNGAFFFMIIMVGLFSITYIALDTAYGKFHTFAQGNIDTSASKNTVSQMDIAWTYLPGAVLFSFLVWVINRGRRDRDNT
jgi:hypothetical protein